jgi:hypothetical protein
MFRDCLLSIFEQNSGQFSCQASIKITTTVCFVHLHQFSFDKRHVVNGTIRTKPRVAFETHSTNLVNTLITYNIQILITLLFLQYDITRIFRTEVARCTRALRHALINFSQKFFSAINKWC